MLIKWWVMFCFASVSLYFYHSTELLWSRVTGRCVINNYFGSSNMSYFMLSRFSWLILLILLFFIFYKLNFPTDHVNRQPQGHWWASVSLVFCSVYITVGKPIQHAECMNRLWWASVWKYLAPLPSAVVFLSATFLAQMKSQSPLVLWWWFSVTALRPRSDGALFSSLGPLFCNCS